ncbi:MAG: GNAT family N-acetyltransferase [Solirubrobacteraceae bacterium]
MPEDPQIVPFAHHHLTGLMELFASERWSYGDDGQRTLRALTAPGSLTLVAIEEDEVRGVIQVLGDGEIQAFLALLLVDSAHRGTGVGRRLLSAALAEINGLRIDVISCADGFYQQLGFRRVSGLRRTLDADGGA